MALAGTKSFGQGDEARLSGGAEVENDEGKSKKQKTICLVKVDNLDKL
jgi:hypothetical protein